jgi:uncharacterized repeat protein (TIGR03803 family)
MGQSPPLQSVPGHVPAATAHLAPTGRLEPTRQLKLAISLPLRDKEGLTNLLRNIYDPSGPGYHHYLTSAQFAERFGPTTEDYRAVTAFAEAHGLRVAATHPNRSLLDVTGSVSKIEEAFHVTLRTYSHPREKRTFYAPEGEPSLELAAPVLHISGLDNYTRPHPMSLRKKTPAVSAAAVPAPGSGPNGAYLGNDFRAAYVPGVSLTGAGQNIGLLEFDGYYPSDISAYQSLAGLASVPLTNVYLDGFDGSPGQNNLEVALDIDMVVCMAPGLSSVIIYEGELTDDILNRMATDNLASQLSASWTYPIDGATDQIFQQFAAQGQSFCNASGDNDAWVGEIATPCDDPNITSVGGTTLTTTGPGGGWVSETVWNWYLENGSNYDGVGSSGGISATYPIPSWQTGVNMTVNQGSTTYRNIPDVALTADNVFVIADGGQAENVGGTSCAAQLWAAFVALANEQAAAYRRPPVGFVNPALYALGLSANYANCFHDIATGNNTWTESLAYFYAVPGYDLCSGWGTPMPGLINLLALDSLQISPSVAWAASGASGGPLTPSFESYTLTNGGSTTLTWTAAATAPWLSVSLDGGTLSPGAAETVVVGLNGAASNLFPGVYGGSVSFTNLTDGAVQDRAVVLSIIKPPVILTQPASLSTIGGTTATFTATAIGGLPLFCQWQLNGTNLSDNGRISGSQTNLVDGTELSGSISSALTITNLSDADAGTYVFVVSNAAGVAISSNAVLTIFPSGPVIVLQPASQTALVGAMVQFTVAADGSGPFNYQWQQDGTNLADGGGILGSSTPALTLSNVSSASIGTYTVVVSNSLGGVTSSGAGLVVQVAGPGGLVSADGPPIIATQPASLAALPGSAATFTVLSAGDLPLLYQWQFDDANIDGATNATLTVANLTTNQAGAYNVLISNALGATNSSNAILTVLTGSQELITFDDLPYRILPVPAGYGNLTWSNFDYLNGVVSRPSGFNTGVVSLPKIAYNNGGTPAAISASSPFALFSAYLTAGFNDNLQVEALGYNGSTLSYDNTYTLSATNPTLIPFNYVGVTSVQFISSGGTPHRGYIGSGAEFIMDNVSAFVQPVPPPLPPPLAMSLLYTFDGFDGGYPVAALCQAADGNLYGATEYGGTYGEGTVFRMTTNGVLSTLLSFGSFNAFPAGALTQGFDGKLYGTTEYGGTNDNGTIFCVTTNGVLSTLASFNYQVTGGYPSAALLQGSDGNFYGATSSGGAYGLGTVFKMTSEGALSPLAFFDGANGTAPSGPLARGADGKLYGTTSTGGANDAGTIFRVTTEGFLTVLFSFGGSAIFPSGGLVEGADGNFYGTTEEGGTNNSGTFFCVTATGISTLASFDYDVTGSSPSALIQGTDGSFYGTTADGGAFGTTFFGGTFGAGTVFNVTTNGVLTPLAAFQCTNGLLPQAGLIQAADGNFYGTTSYGGVGFDGFYNGGDGVVFRLGAASATAPPAVVTQPVSQNAPVGGMACFRVSGGGPGPLTYSWQRNGASLAGATFPSYTVTNVQASDSGAQFSCMISNPYGSILTSNASLTVFSSSGPVFSFRGPEGAWPSSTLVQNADGAFYGTTEYGGIYGDGSVFSLTTNGVQSTLASFDFYETGANPSSGLVQGSDGNFYGTAAFGGEHAEGTVFKINPDGALTVLAAFDTSNGSEPYAALLQAADGNFYGSTYYGGTYNAGTIFRVTTNGNLTSLVSFTGLDGAQPSGALLQAADGNFYGTTYYGGTSSAGTVFSLTTNGTLTTLVSFSNSNGAFPQAGLALGPGGLLYGTTQKGGMSGDGTVFSVTTNGALTTLFSFAGALGSVPNSALVLGSDGNFYGTTTGGGAYGDGTVFSLLTNGLVLPLFSFAGTNGSFPSASLLQASDGNLYGTTTAGGIGYDGLYWSGNGVVFRLAGVIQPGPPLIVTQPASQTVPVGGAVGFSVTAVGAPPLSYLWQRNGGNITGAALSSYTTNNVQLSDSGSVFTCLVSDAYGAVITSNATLTVAPAIALPPPPTNPPIPPAAPTATPLPLAVLYSFAGGDGGHPSSALIQGADGNFYGTTAYGGTYQDGTVFCMTSNGTLSTVLSFNGSNGAYPYSALTQGADGSLYGTTTEGGAYGQGTVFRAQTNGAVATLLSFDDSNGAYPYGALAQGADGNLYGTTSEGGTNGYGTLFSIATNGSLGILLSFDNATNGAYPYGGLAPGADGLLYGATQYGGTNDNGTLFSVTTNGVLTTLASFDYAVTGGYPTAALVQGTDGNFYGVTEYGGTNDNGAIFSLTPSGSLTTLASFDNANGAEPFGGLVQGADGNFYGTTEYGGTYDNGTIFRFGANGALIGIYAFGSTNGFYPQAGLVQGRDGLFYGTATFGGQGFNGENLSGDGTVFRLGAAPANIPPRISAQPATQIVTVNGTAVFSVTAGGGQPLSYSWLRNGQPIAGAAQPFYAAQHVQLTDSGSQFSCVINNGYGSVTSSVVALTVFNNSGPLFSFDGPAGGYPSAALVQAADGNFYGTTTYGGTYGEGTLFRLTTNGLLATLLSFDLTNGAQPSAALAQGADGNLYGTTEEGGTYQYGTAFRMTTNGVFTILASFSNSNGAYPAATLTQGSDGIFYGTASGGGANGAGAIFSLTTNGVLNILFSFDGTNGAAPSSALLQTANGILYGATQDGGTNGYGTIFSITTNGIFTPLFSFNDTNGAYPQGGLAQGTNGCFYGATTEGGTDGNGTLFCLSTNGSVTSLFSFAETNGSSPAAALFAGSDGNFYGTTSLGGTYGDGTVFCLSTNGAVTSLFSFSGPNGSFPSAPLIQGNDGNLYGTTAKGGLGYDGLYWSGNGTVFRLSGAISLQAPQIVAQPANQAVPAGGAATFSVTALSSTPLSYLWQRNGAPISGATLSSYTANNVQASDSGSVFACLISNAYGAVISATAALTVGPPSLVQNGGFELGSFADWTGGGNMGDCSVTSLAPFAHSGLYGAELGSVGSLGSISQTLTTTAGELYQISCWLVSDGQTPNEFSISWNGTTLYDQKNAGKTSWNDLQFQAVATDTNTVLAFGFRDDPSYLGLDDITVLPLGLAPPQLQGVTVNNGLITFSWIAQIGQIYQVQVTSNLDQPNWTALGPPLSASNSSITISEPIGGNTQQFYRFVAQP